MTEAESESKWGCTSMKILFSAAVNFKMINKMRSIDSRGSLEYSQADSLMKKQKMEWSKLGGRGEKVQCQRAKLIQLPKRCMTWVSALSHSHICTHPFSPPAPSPCSMSKTLLAAPLHDSSWPYLANCTCLMPCLMHLKHINPPPNPSSLSWLLSRCM